MSRVHETSRSHGNFPWIPDRPSSGGQQFPSRWATLPQISPGSPVPSGENQMVPYKGSDRPLEGRLAVAEKSNRALLDEVARLQSDSKTQTRHMEEILHEERGYRKQLENSLRASNELIAQLASRIQRAEERLRDEHSTVSSLVNQTKGMENSIMGNQKEMLNRKDAQMTRIQELRDQLDESLRAKDKLERVTYEMADEMRQLKARVDTQAMDFSQITNELKNSTRRLEEDTRQTVSSMAKSGENNNTTQLVTHQLRAQLESRLAELRDVLVDLRKKQEVESQERRGLEQKMQLRLGEMNSSVTEQARKRDEVMYTLEQQNREKNHMSETEKFRLQSQINEVTDEVQRKISQREMKIKDDVQKNISNVENLLRQEQEDRMKFERSIRDAMEERYEALRRLQEDSSQGQKESAKHEKKKQNETLHKLNDGLQLLEKEIQEYQKRQEKVLAAEVSSRKQREGNTKQEIKSLKEKVDVAIATMQQAISGITLQLATQKESVRDELKGMMEDGAGSNTRNLVDMDSRLLSLNQRLTEAEVTLEAKIQAILRLPLVSDDKEAAVVTSQNVRERVETITLWQDVAQNTLKELEEQNKRSDEELVALREKHTLLKSELEEKIKELEERINNMRPRSGNSGDPGISPDELESLQKGIRKLAESIQTVKTVLGMKIQSEQKLRVEETKTLQDELARLQLMIEPLMKIKPEPAVFIKPEDVEKMANKEVEDQAPEINKWSLYTTYRWLHMKSRWMYILWRKKARENYLSFPMAHRGNKSKANIKDPDKKNPENNENKDSKDELQNDKPGSDENDDNDPEDNNDNTDDDKEDAADNKNSSNNEDKDL